MSTNVFLLLSILKTVVQLIPWALPAPNQYEPALNSMEKDE